MSLPLNSKARLCIGCSLFYVVIGWSILHDRIESDAVNMAFELVVIPTSLLIYFVAWKIYKFKVGKLIVLFSALSLVLLILAVFLIK